MYNINISGKTYPVHFGTWAYKLIVEALNIDERNFLSGLDIVAMQEQLVVARIGLVEGAKYAARNYNQPIPEEIMQLDDERTAAMLDESPEALEQILSIYVEQTYGKKTDALIKELETRDSNTAEQLKNAMRKVRAVIASLSNE
jgi:hypothetical protein